MNVGERAERRKKRRRDAGATSECCGVDGGDAGFYRDAVYFYGFGEDGALKAVGQYF